MPEATLPAIFITSWLVGLSGAMSPGPLLAFNIRESMRMGPWAGPAVATGHALLELGMVVVLYLGLARFLSSDLAIITVGLLGGAVLLWLSWRMVRNPLRDTPWSGTATARNSPHVGPVLGGVVVSLSNPFWAIWWATIGLAYLVWAREIGLPGLGSFYIGHILSDFAWFSLVALAVGTGRRLIEGRPYQWIMTACGVFLGGMGVFFIGRSVGILLA